MAEYIGRLATTGPVDHAGTSVNITREAIESISDQVNGERCLPVIPDHDPFSMPIGKIKEAWIEPFGDEYAVMARIHEEDDAVISVHVRSGTELVYLDFVDAPKPFVQQFQNLDEKNLFTVSVDLANFANIHAHTAFMDAARRIDDKIDSKIIGRHSLEPEPLLHLVLRYPELCAALSVGLWVLSRVEKFVRYTIDETLKKVADEIADFVSSKIKKIVKAYQDCQSGEDKSMLMEVVVPGDMDLILLVRIDHADDIPTIDLSKLTTEMEKYGDLLQEAEEVTFARTGDGDWELQHLKTRTGEVFGTLGTYKRTMEQLRRMPKRSDVK